MPLFTCKIIPPESDLRGISCVPGSRERKSSREGV